jgi:hypothetical protein
MENFEMKKSPIPIGYFQDSGETTRLLLALMIAHADRNKIDAKMRKIMAVLSKAHSLPATNSARRLRAFAAERGERVPKP